MKKTGVAKPQSEIADELRPEYRLDYRKAKPNRFASQVKQGGLVVVLDADIAEVFSSSESVNAVLRALIENMPKRNSRRGASQGAGKAGK